MATIDLKLKTYDELQFEIMNLTTKNYLQQQEIERLNNIINETKKLVNIAFEPDSQYIDYDFGAELLKQTFIDILYNDIGIDGKELKGSDE